MMNSTQEKQVPLKLFSLNDSSKEGSKNQVILKEKSFKTFFEMKFTYRKVESLRVTNQGDECDVYRNLNKPSFFSLKQRKGDFKGKVSLYAKVIVIKKPSFSISEASRKRLILQKCKNVHSYLRGSFHSASDDTSLINTEMARACTYNPYYAGYFFDCESKKEITNEEVKKYSFAVLFGSNVYLYKEHPKWVT